MNRKKKAALAFSLFILVLFLTATAFQPHSPTLPPPANPMGSTTPGGTPVLNTGGRLSLIIPPASTLL